jgi:hypothetical protein
MIEFRRRDLQRLLNGFGRACKVREIARRAEQPELRVGKFVPGYEVRGVGLHSRLKRLKVLTCSHGIHPCFCQRERKDGENKENSCHPRQKPCRHRQRMPGLLLRRLEEVNEGKGEEGVGEKDAHEENDVSQPRRVEILKENCT